MLEIKFTDSTILATLKQMQDKTQDLRPVFAELGELLVESVKERFAESRGPDGQAWAANQQSTIDKLLSNTKGNFKQKTITDKSGKKRKVKAGGLTKKGAGRVSGKKPLIGESKALSGGIKYKATSDTLSIGSSRIQSRVMQFGAAQGAFGRTKRGSPIPWGTIPARPYLGFSSKDQTTISDIVQKYLTP